MTPSEYQDLVTLLAKKFERIDVQFERIDLRFEEMGRQAKEMEERLSARLTKVEVGQESLRSDVQTIAELVTANGRGIGENRRAIGTLTEKVELNTVGIHAVRDRVASLEDHLRAV